MTKEERENRIKEIKDNIFDIEVGSDYLSAKDWERIRELRAELAELEKEAEND